MDGHTEPLIAVIGHPIAGNPSQFAIECALESLQLDYRVTSFDVPPDRLVAALDGLQVLGFHGVLVDDALASDVGQWCDNQNDSGASDSADGQNSSDDRCKPINCLFRDPQSPEKLVGFDAQAAWLIATTQSHFADREMAITDGLWLGARSDLFPDALKSENEMMISTRTPAIESVELANLIVLADRTKKAVPLDATEWPQDDGSTLVLDLTDGHDELTDARDRGYTTISRLTRQTGTIGESLLRWTGQRASATIIREAIEEYLGV
ncbi:MAG: hypothetical protein HKN47_08255 [Pirellulaceae bacterium]|nr:hypothetical protein [Pirellulaceae bacterium]